MDIIGDVLGLYDASPPVPTPPTRPENRWYCVSVRVVCWRRLSNGLDSTDAGMGRLVCGCTAAVFDAAIPGVRLAALNNVVHTMREHRRGKELVV